MVNVHEMLIALSVSPCGNASLLCFSCIQVMNKTTLVGEKTAQLGMKGLAQVAELL